MGCPGTPKDFSILVAGPTIGGFGADTPTELVKPAVPATELVKPVIPATELVKPAIPDLPMWCPAGTAAGVAYMGTEFIVIPWAECADKP